ncbi:MAG: hypothetical protein DWQ35_15980 [Planctomycetota bacterium]|nr:MAG: hypothetical protein DWQ35_15980 [Planctomycetota bacterium]REK18269.1 MAG: hypothetical protein DWQ42_20535 [Planctomycetota bacterium]REK49139.1 MAG: hypothetical protein DWQ46_01135 [Planctomycetota bacterium]
MGLSANDELILWGCLALTLADPNSAGQLYATRHYILRQLGLIDQRQRRGGRQYTELHAALERLSTVRYLNDGFYDPVRAEHRKVGFGFFSYSLPVDPNSSRAWRIAWDPIFFEFAQAANGALRFDLTIYRKLDPASRRLFLFLTKLFARHETTHPLDLTALAVNVIGFSVTLRPGDHKAKVNRCLRKLVDHGVIRDDVDPFQKVGVGQYRLVLNRGPACNRRRHKVEAFESPLVEPLASIGLDGGAIQRLLRKYSHQLLREWTDITLAARERFGHQFFRRSPAAYLVDNLKAASLGIRTPPDWWLEIRKSEERRQAKLARHRRSQSGDGAQRLSRAIEAVDEVQESVFQQFLAAGQPETVAKQNAARFAALHRQRDRKS